MKVEIVNDYVNVETSDFVEELELGIEEQGIWIEVRVHDHEQPGIPGPRFHGLVPWEPLIEEALTQLVDDCRAAPYPFADGVIQMDELIEGRDEWIAILEKFIERLRMLPAASPQP